MTPMIDAVAWNFLVAESFGSLVAEVRREERNMEQTMMGRRGEELMVRRKPRGPTMSALHQLDRVPVPSNVQDTTPSSLSRDRPNAIRSIIPGSTILYRQKFETG